MVSRATGSKPMIKRKRKKKRVAKLGSLSVFHARYYSYYYYDNNTNLPFRAFVRFSPVWIGG